MSFYQHIHITILNILDHLEFKYCKKCGELMPRFGTSPCDYC